MAPALRQVALVDVLRILAREHRLVLLLAPPVFIDGAGAVLEVGRRVLDDHVDLLVAINGLEIGNGDVQFIGLVEGQGLGVVGQFHLPDAVAVFDLDGRRDGEQVGTRGTHVHDRLGRLRQAGDRHDDGRIGSQVVGQLLFDEEAVGTDGLVPAGVVALLAGAQSEKGGAGQYAQKYSVDFHIFQALRVRTSAWKDPAGRHNGSARS